MLPPIPQHLANPAAPQQDVIRPRPEIAPVTPVQSASGEAAINLDRRHPQDASEIAKEQQRKKQQRKALSQAIEAGQDEEAERLREEQDLPRQGLWVDVEV